MTVEGERDWVGAEFAARYAVESKVGRGASATVYRARDLENDQVVALKVSRPYVLTKHRRAARFLREVQAVQRVDHEGLARVLHWGIEHDCAYIVMELVEAEDLFDIIRREAPLSDQRAIAITIAILEVLQAAHDLGVVHRDLKPRNVMILPDGSDGSVRVKVLDFGLAKLIRIPADEEGTLPLDLTKPGAVLGTPHYMAPEQVRDGGDIDGRADLYGMSVMLYEMLTNRRPLEERNAVRALIAIGTEKPVPPSDHVADIDPDLEKLIMRGLEKKAADRFASATEMIGRLRRISARIAEDHAPTRAYKAKTGPGVDIEDPLSEDEQLTRVHRPKKKRKKKSSGSEFEVPTRVYKQGEGPKAPKMIAKDLPDPDESGEHAPTRVMRKKVAHEALGAASDPAPKVSRERSETEKGIRAALLTVTALALAAAIGRWLELW